VHWYGQLFFTTASQVALSGPGYASFLRRHPEVKSLALIYFQDPAWGYQYRNAWRTLLSERDVEIVGEYENAEFAPDFKTPLVNILQHKPDAFFVAHDPTTLIPAAKQLRFQGKKALQQQPDSPELAIPTLHYEGVSGVMDFSHPCAGNQSRWHLKQFKQGRITLIERRITPMPPPKQATRHEC